MISDYDDKSEKLVIETPSGLPEKIRHVMNVLSALRVKDDAMFLAVVSDCIDIDPLHLCRMAKSGVLSELGGVMSERIVLSGTDMHIPFDVSGVEASMPPAEIIVNLVTNSVTAWFYEEEAESYQPVAPSPVYAEQLMSIITELSDGSADSKLPALLRVFSVLRDAAYLCYHNQSPLETERIESVFALVD